MSESAVESTEFLTFLWQAHRSFPTHGIGTFKLHEWRCLMNWEYTLGPLRFLEVACIARLYSQS